MKQVASRAFTLTCALLAFAAHADQTTDLSGCLGALGHVLTSDLPEGPRYYIQAGPNTRPIEEIKELNVVHWNVLNFAELQGKYLPDPVTGQLSQQLPKIKKPVGQILLQAKMLKDAQTDIGYFMEVDTLRTLNSFDVTKLGDQFVSMLVEGNDIRNIDIGSLLKKDLPFDTELISHRNVLNAAGGKLYSRDQPAYLYRPKGADPKSPPLFIELAVHNKSQRDQPGDPRSVNVRTAQVVNTAEIAKKFEAQFPGVPIVNGGDFNEEVTASTFNALRAAGFKDAFDIVGLPADQRITHTFHPRDEPAHKAQMDAVFVNQAAQAMGLIKRAEVVPYRDALGRAKPPADTFQQRQQNPSDHMMVRVVYDFEKVLADYHRRLAAWQRSR